MLLRKLCISLKSTCDCRWDLKKLKTKKACLFFPESFYRLLVHGECFMEVCWCTQSPVHTWVLKSGRTHLWWWTYGQSEQTGTLGVIVCVWERVCEVVCFFPLSCNGIGVPLTHQDLHHVACGQQRICDGQPVSPRKYRKNDCLSITNSSTVSSLGIAVSLHLCVWNRLGFAEPWCWRGQRSCGIPHRAEEWRNKSSRRS